VTYARTRSRPWPQDKYILDGHTVVPQPDLKRWGQWMQGANRSVRRTQPRPGVLVSTVFLGLDHSFGGDKPHLFETMVFINHGKGGNVLGDGVECERTSTWGEAEDAHKRWVEKASDPNWDRWRGE
jgi:hypothetical protein